MALIRCPECNREVSDKAKVCLNCGFSVAEYVERQEKIRKIQEETEKEAVLYVKQRKKKELEKAIQEKKAEEDRKNLIYNEAIKRYNSKSSVEIEKAEKLFSTILGWKDSDIYILKCKDCIDEVRRKELIQEEKEKRKKERYYCF